MTRTPRPATRTTARTTARRTTRALLALVVPLTLAAPLVVTASASANDADVIRRGSCTGSTDWKIKAKPDDGRIEVEAEIDSNVNGQTWGWVLRHDGSVAARGSSTTKAPSGSFSVERRLVDAAGADAFTFRATNAASGEVCVAKVSL
ncbi:hypothetical protein [Nocardioides kribbensis]|uniref:Secreted protein n=1 Tax=Nocardioides kribbensis TaxID=305517 RepID=A0ABV1NYE1_9ACTN